MSVPYLFLIESASTDFWSILEGVNRVSEVPWPKEVVIAKIGHRLFEIRLSDFPNPAPTFPYDITPPANMRIRWDIVLTEQGKLTVTPQPEVFPTRLVVELPQFMEKLVGYAGLQALSTELPKGGLAPYMPPTSLLAKGLKVEPNELGEAKWTVRFGSPTVDSNWGYIHDVKAYRRVLAEELLKML